MEVDEAITLSVEEEELFEVILAACARSLVGGTVARVCGIHREIKCKNPHSWYKVYLKRSMFFGFVPQTQHVRCV